MAMQVNAEIEKATGGETVRGEAAFLCEPELLRRLPVSRRTLGNWRKAGKLPFVKLPGSRRVLYHWPSVTEAFLRRQQLQTS